MKALVEVDFLKYLVVRFVGFVFAIVAIHFILHPESILVAVVSAILGVIGVVISVNMDEPRQFECLNEYSRAYRIIMMILVVTSFGMVAISVVDGLLSGVYSAPSFYVGAFVGLSVGVGMFLNCYIKHNKQSKFFHIFL